MSKPGRNFECDQSPIRELKRAVRSLPPTRLAGEIRPWIRCSAVDPT